MKEIVSIAASFHTTHTTGHAPAAGTPGDAAQAEVILITREMTYQFIPTSTGGTELAKVPAAVDFRFRATPHQLRLLARGFAQFAADCEALPAASAAHGVPSKAPTSRPKK